MCSRLNYCLAIVFVLCLAIIDQCAFCGEPPAQVSQLTLTILHDNDLHGHLLPFAYIEKAKSSLEQPSRGGAARRATLVRRLRAQIKNPTMLVDTGDVFTRGPLWNAYDGLADIEAMNAIGYQVAAIGNNEFKDKDGVEQNDAAGAQATLLQVIKRSRFPWVCANAANAQGAFLQGVEPYVVRNFKGVRVGFLGLTAPRSAHYPQTKGWTISDPIVAAQKWIPEARKHCDILVALTHLGVDDDKKLAAQTTGLDAIIGGDSHTFLYKAVVVKNSLGKPVPIVQDGEFGADLGRFDLHMVRDSDGHWRIGSYAYSLLPIGPSVPEASDVKAVLAPYVHPFLKVVGRLEQIANIPQARRHQTTQVLVNAMRQQTGADLAINPDGGGLFDVLRHKAVTLYDIYAAMPFHDNVATANLTGTALQSLLKAHPDTVVAGDAENLSPARTYRVALIDFEAAVVYGLPTANIKDTGLDQRKVVAAYLGHTLRK